MNFLTCKFKGMYKIQARTACEYSSSQIVPWNAGLMPYSCGRNATVGMKSGKLLSNEVAGGRGRHPGCRREAVVPLWSPFLAPSLLHAAGEECHHLYAPPPPPLPPLPASKLPSPLPPAQIFTLPNSMESDCLHLPQQEPGLPMSQACL